MIGNIGMRWYIWYKGIDSDAMNLLLALPVVSDIFNDFYITVSDK